MNKSRRSGEVPNLDWNIFVHWCTPVAFGMRHGHWMSGYSSFRFSISALGRALIDDLFDDIFLFSVVVYIFDFPIGSLFVLPCDQCFDWVCVEYNYRVNRVFLFSFLRFRLFPLWRPIQILCVVLFFVVVFYSYFFVGELSAKFCWASFGILCFRYVWEVENAILSRAECHRLKRWFSSTTHLFHVFWRAFFAPFSPLFLSCLSASDVAGKFELLL